MTLEVKTLTFVNLEGDEMDYFYHHNEWAQGPDSFVGHILNVKQYDLQDAWHPLYKADGKYLGSVISRTQHKVDSAIREAVTQNIDYVWVRYRP